MAKEKVATDEKFEKQDVDLFDMLAAIDKKDYGYYDRLSPEQQKKFVPFMMIQWVSAIKGNSDLQTYYLSSTQYHANKHYFNETVYKHPKLQWLMLCAASPGLGKQFHQWIPNISQKVAKLEAPAKLKDIKEYYKKIYPKADSDIIDEISKAYVDSHKRKKHLSELFPQLKQADIEALNEITTDEQIAQYERDNGN